MFVDTHTHPISKDTERYPLRRVERRDGDRLPARRPGEGGMVEKGLDTEEMLSTMAAAGVHKTILVQSSSLYGFDNTYIADSAAAHPQECVGLCAVDVLAEDAADVLTYWVEERGMRGVRLTLPEELDNPRTYAVWQRASDLAIPLDVQLRPTHFAKLARVLELFPGVSVAIDHAGNANRRLPDGRPAPAEPPEALLSLSRYPRLFVKLTSQNVDGVLESGAPEEAFFGPLLQRFGARRLLWGTDFPATADQSYAERLEQSLQAFSFMAEEARRWVMGQTALQLWPELEP